MRYKMEEKEMILEKQNSVEMSLNAKGQLSGKVKVYAEEIENAYTVASIYMEKLRTRIKEENG